MGHKIEIKFSFKLLLLFVFFCFVLFSVLWKSVRLSMRNWFRKGASLLQISCLATTRPSALPHRNPVI